MVGVPKTIDNDINLLDRSFGFDTAMRLGDEDVDEKSGTVLSKWL